MTEIMRENKAKREEIASLMKEDDLRRLVDAATDKDRTMRIYATEFLSDLGDPRVAGPAFERMETADDNGKYNLVLVLKSAYPYADTVKRKEIGQKLDGLAGSVGPKTRDLIESVTAQSPADQQRYWVIVGSFTDRSKAEAQAAKINRESKALSAFVGKRQPENQYYPVIVGDYVSRQQADELMASALALKTVREYGSTPYLSAYADRRP